MQCPKCHAPMHTYNRNGVQIEQCSNCRGIFLDYGELEALTRLESQWSQPAPPAPPAPQAYPAAPAAPAAPAWGAPHGGHHGGHYGHHRQKGFGRMLFSS
ncbi:MULTISPECIES: TFIIB-type zinc ribbon-containing protein [Streptomyces]|uniref:Zf-TFIIB domain-containing protein n=1 Tax=Streptomyces antibioticus TaxID=1890 RepID=A0AAE6Y754_STRAT|nr:MULTISPECIES: zf-TFIIB domain-containing protein [Streptomyces]MBO7937300.1 zf-TFIIB domain-containing protein [Streptomyces sp. S9]MCX4740298.1 zf-TFIIB domain-containing protein [Streptomyces antibioticus]MCX5167896.1 zf-TFIIB domain-containing protein [Streptomyces antibioticus]NUV64911.1 zf-TFIIB domain-containing protein [Streptomyces sp. CAI-85]OOQ53694.1 zf-TFIIB domain containing protein [Streptomyces antibioticus]